MSIRRPPAVPSQLRASGRRHAISGRSVAHPEADASALAGSNQHADLVLFDVAGKSFSTRKLHKRLHTHRTFDKEQVDLNEKAPTCGAFTEPSDGLEPSTPSLPCAASGGWSQPTATVLAHSCGSEGCCACDRLPPIATTGLHKGSILSYLIWPRRPPERGRAVARCSRGAPATA